MSTREWREAHKADTKAYAAKWRAAHPDYKAKWRAAHPGHHARQMREWRRKNPERARAYEAAYSKAQWLRIVDSYELHEAHLLKLHNRRSPGKPYRPNYKARTPPTWMMHRALWEYAGGEPTPAQKAFALALLRSRRAQRFGEKEGAE